MLIARCISALTDGPANQRGHSPHSDSLAVKVAPPSLSPPIHRHQQQLSHPHTHTYLSCLHLYASPKPTRSFHNLFQVKRWTHTSTLGSKSIENWTEFTTIKPSSERDRADCLSCSVCNRLLQIWSVVARALFFTVVCWGGGIMAWRSVASTSC